MRLGYANRTLTQFASLVKPRFCVSSVVFLRMVSFLHSAALVHGAEGGASRQALPSAAEHGVGAKAPAPCSVGEDSVQTARLRRFQPVPAERTVTKSR